MLKPSYVLQNVALRRSLIINLICIMVYNSYLNSIVLFAVLINFGQLFIIILSNMRYIIMRMFIIKKLKHMKA